ncbi:3'-5' exonuclease [uncultured Neptuniibacter sp.]|uniref:3'-5' exonuclease n=1 Tax=uncultured Neptuniibacter sp. TaxID=502143 RepID=UPI00263997F6|nr:3'-5' exonuclease [uncultured Neptuniibacter sp.]
MHVEYTTDGMKHILDTKKYLLIVDVEHTCTEDGSIPPDMREIIELGAVLVCAKSFDVISEFNSLVSPIIHPILSDFCIELTGINQEQISQAQPFSAVFERFIAWLPSSTTDYVFCSWGAYDLDQINIDCNHHNLDEFSPTMKLNLKKGFAKSQRIKPQVGMRKAFELKGLELAGKHHRSLADVQNIVKLLPYIFLQTEKQ